MTNNLSEQLSGYIINQDTKDIVIALLAQSRNAANCAAFLLPHLQPGMRVLDCGCGPGSITVGLAEIVAPGEVVGIDADIASLSVATRLADERGILNARFESASVYQIPYPDASFDVVFSHAVLLHLSDPIAALKEMKRVLKPGGIVGIRNDDMDGIITWPPDPLLQRTWVLSAALIRQGGGDLQGAKRSRSWLIEAGFDSVVGSASYESFGTSENIAVFGQVYAKILERQKNRFVELGLAATEEIDRVREAWLNFAQLPDAFFAKAWCEAIGRA